MRSTLGLCLVVLALLSLPAVAHARFHLAPGDRAVVLGTEGEGLHLRAAPGTDQPSLGLLVESGQVDILDGPLMVDGLEWYRVQSAEGRGWTGWVAGRFLVGVDHSATFRALHLQTGHGFVAKLTAYSDGPEGGALGSITRSGTHTRWGVVAVDPRVIPLGSRLLIQGFEGTIFIAEDTGSDVQGSHVDIWFPSVSQALHFGVRHRRITVLDD